MAGYAGYSMSNNAVAAYEDGERPLSKWKKSDVIEKILDCDYLPDIENVEVMLKKIPSEVLKARFLYQSSWHHTSNRYNKTNFYSFDENATEGITVETLEKLAEKIKKAAPIVPEKKMAEVEYAVWGGSRKRPKLLRWEKETVEIDGTWAYTSDGKKKLSGNWIRWKEVA